MRSLHLLCAALLAAVSGTVAAAAPERLALGVVPSLGPAATALQIEFGKSHPEMVVTIGVAELYRALIGWKSPTDAAFTLRDGYFPGDLGFDPLGLKGLELVGVSEREECGTADSDDGDDVENGFHG